jgi:hypothetical protein
MRVDIDLDVFRGHARERGSAQRDTGESVVVASSSGCAWTAIRVRRGSVMTRARACLVRAVR